MHAANYADGRAFGQSAIVISPMYVARKKRRLGSFLTDDYNFFAGPMAPVGAQFSNLVNDAAGLISGGPTGMALAINSNPSITSQPFLPPGSGSDIFSNAFNGGNLTPSQVSALMQEETDSLIQAGADPASAAAQAQSDMAALNPSPTAPNPSTLIFWGALVFVGGWLLLK